MLMALPEYTPAYYIRFANLHIKNFHKYEMKKNLRSMYQTMYTF